VTIRVLMPPAVKGGSFIAAVDGALRMIDPPRKCWGYHTACTCEACVDRETGQRRKRKDAQRAVLVCVCEKPLRDGDNCIRCGKPPLSQAA
jgi:hypothetical protein